MRTMQELRVDIRDKVPELVTRIEMKAAEMGMKGLFVSGPHQASFYDTMLAEYCYFVLIACDGFRAWLYDEHGNERDEYESDLLDWLDAGGGERGIDGFYADVEEARQNFPAEVQDCNRLLMPILDAGRAKGLDDEDLFEYTWLMMLPFLTGRETPPTEDDWHQKQAELALKRAVKADEDRQLARTRLEHSIRNALTRDRDYTLGLIMGILAEIKDPIP
jgi:hypothetical protein